MHASWTVALGLAAVVAVGCVVTVGDDDGATTNGEGWGTGRSEWDLRTTNAIAAIGWPDDLELSAYEIRSDRGLERILLPGGVTLEGFDRANPSRAGGSAAQPFSDELSSLVVTWSRDVAEVGATAVAVAEQAGLDPTGFGVWARRNADEPDLSAGGAQATAGGSLADEVEIDVRTRAFEDGDAGLFVTVVWLGGE